MTLSYYDRQGHPIDLLQWANSSDDKQVAKTSIATDAGPVDVSTLWLGLNHNYSDNGPPLIFETMIFGGEDDQESWRYITETEAQAGHARVVAALLAKLPGSYTLDTA